jgi:16S rRNA (cytidine1402-2'-O)-methyltransferase
VLYEAPHRIERTMADLREACGPDRRVAVCRELTKLFEDVQRGTLGTVDVGEPRGEYVIVLDGARPDVTVVDDDTIRAALRDELAAGATRKDAAAAVSARLGVPRKTAYALATAL